MESTPSVARALRAQYQRWWPALAVGALAMLVYALTLAPSLTWAHSGTDGGDLVTAAATGRLPHPPGFPVYYALARLAVRGLPGDPAWVLNLLSAGTAAGASALVAASAIARGLRRWAAVIAGLTVTVAPWLWSQAVITEVYTTAAFFVALAMLALAFGRDARPSADLWVGLSLGLAIGVHPTAALVVLLAAAQPPTCWRWLALGVSLGLLSYGLLPLVSSGPQPWGDLGSLPGWLHYVTGRSYWGNAFSLPRSYWGPRGVALLVLALRQLTPVGFLLVLIGLRQQWRQSRRLAAAIAVALVAAAAYAVGYDSGDSWVYLVAYLPVGGFLLAFGLDWLLSQRIPAGLALLLPIALVVSNWQGIDSRRATEATDWLARTLSALPQGAVVLTQRDRHTFALWYASEAEPARGDLAVVDQRLWGYAPYVAFLGAAAGYSATEGSETQLADLYPDRPQCIVDGGGGVACP